LVVDYNPFAISSKNLLITGASSGIGRSVAIECSRMGAKLLITGRDEQKLNETLGLLDGHGHKMITADFRDKADILNLGQASELIDGLVHSAGYTRMQPFHFITEENLNDILQVNFTSPVMLTQILLKEKKIKKGASIVFVSSINGLHCTFPGQGAYAASKSAVNGIVKSMALELAGKGIRVNSVNPAMVSTNILAEKAITDEQVIEDMKKYPLKRYGYPEEIAHAVIYLLSEGSSWVTGTSLLIDGGYTLQ
jgi:NAD(P)-dependent dehydrogenase (short-subunit alcohol dehydrogenase family)